MPFKNGRKLKIIGIEREKAYYEYCGRVAREVERRLSVATKGRLGYKELLDPQRREYNREATRVHETAKRLLVIVKIERLQNERQWKSY